MAPPLPNIEHVILLMFENRSFDNVLGAFYPATQNPDGGLFRHDNASAFSTCAARPAAAGSTTETVVRSNGPLR